MNKLWFYTKSGSTEKQGPLPHAEIRQLIADGTLTQADLVWAEGMTNWEALGKVPELSGSLPTERSASQAQVGLPDGLVGWMGFVAVMNIVMGVFSCLGCVSAITGIFMIIAGTGLLAAKNALANVDTVDGSLNLFFAKLKTFMQMTGVVYIISLIMMLVFMIFYFTIFAAAIATATGAQP